MLQLLHPIGLLAIAAVIVPVLVHLWNVRKGKTLRVGSIALLSVSSRTRSSRLRISNWPLFLLRCLLLVLLALLLAGPVWNKEQNITKHPGWMLIPGQQLEAAYTHYKPQIDSLLAAGVELHNLSAGFERMQLQDTATLNDTGIAVAPRPWPLLKVLDASLPKGFPLHVFINNRLSAYGGDRPTTHLAIQWHSFAPGDSIASSPALSYVTTDGKIRNIAWVSSPQGNWYREDNVSTLFTAAPDTAVIRVAIYAGQHAADAQYIKAALLAAEQFTGKRIDVTSPAAGQLPATPQNVIFWLDGSANEELRQSLSRHSGTQPDSHEKVSEPSSDVRLLSSLTPKGILFRYDTGRTIQVASWLQEGNEVTGTAGQHKIYQYIAGHPAGTPVWSLADGKPLLTTTEQDGKRVYQFQSRFHPAWGDLVWEDDFVKAILPLVLPSLTPQNVIDLRSIDDRQVKPARIQYPVSSIQNLEYRKQHTETLAEHKVTALSNWFWVLIFIVFAVERIMDYRQQRMQHG